MTILLTAIAGAASIILLLWRFGIHRVARWGLAVDIAGTVFLTWLLAGTYSGAAAALLGGGLLSVTLLMIRRRDERREHNVPRVQREHRSPFTS